MKNLMAILLLFCSCQKSAPLSQPQSILATPASLETTFTKYTIQAGQHFSDNSIFKIVSLSEMKFTVQFDSTAIYTTADSLNQYDINKLYGFSDGDNHHLNSARIGWSWNKNALRLYAYTYYNGVRATEEICTIAIGIPVACEIKVTADEYIFKVNTTTVPMPRFIKNSVAKGYMLFPYFGGDETAPGTIRIFIKENL